MERSLGSVEVRVRRFAVPCSADYQTAQLTMIRSANLDRSSSIRYWSSKAPPEKADKSLFDGSCASKSFQRPESTALLEILESARGLISRRSTRRGGQDWATNPGRNGVAREKRLQGSSPVAISPPPSPSLRPSHPPA